MILRTLCCCVFVLYVHCHFANVRRQTQLIQHAMDQQTSTLHTLPNLGLDQFLTSNVNSRSQSNFHSHSNFNPIRNENNENASNGSNARDKSLKQIYHFCFQSPSYLKSCLQKDSTDIRLALLYGSIVLVWEKDLKIHFGNDLLLSTSEYINFQGEMQMITYFHDMLQNLFEQMSAYIELEYKPPLYYEPTTAATALFEADFMTEPNILTQFWYLATEYVGTLQVLLRYSNLWKTELEEWEDYILDLITPEAITQIRSSKGKTLNEKTMHLVKIVDLSNYFSNPTQDPDRIHPPYMKNVPLLLETASPAKTVRLFCDEHPCSPTLIKIISNFDYLQYNALMDQLVFILTESRRLGEASEKKEGERNENQRSGGGGSGVKINKNANININMHTNEMGDLVQTINSFSISSSSQRPRFSHPLSSSKSYSTEMTETERSSIDSNRDRFIYSTALATECMRSPETMYICDLCGHYQPSIIFYVSQAYILEKYHPYLKYLWEIDVPKDFAVVEFNAYLRDVYRDLRSYFSLPSDYWLEYWQITNWSENVFDMYLSLRGVNDVWRARPPTTLLINRFAKNQIDLETYSLQFFWNRFLQIVQSHRDVWWRELLRVCSMYDWWLTTLPMPQRVGPYLVKQCENTKNLFACIHFIHAAIFDIQQISASSIVVPIKLQQKMAVSTIKLAGNLATVLEIIELLKPPSGIQKAFGIKKSSIKKHSEVYQLFPLQEIPSITSILRNVHVTFLATQNIPRQFSLAEMLNNPTDREDISYQSRLQKEKQQTHLLHQKIMQSPSFLASSSELTPLLPPMPLIPPPFLPLHSPRFISNSPASDSQSSLIIGYAEFEQSTQTQRAAPHERNYNEDFDDNNNDNVDDNADSGKKSVKQTLKTVKKKVSQRFIR